MDESKTVTLQVSPRHAMKDVKWKVRGQAKHRGDRYVTCQGMLLRWRHGQGLRSGEWKRSARDVEEESTRARNETSRSSTDRSGNQSRHRKVETMEMDMDSVIQQLRAWEAFHEAAVGLSSDGRHEDVDLKRQRIVKMFQDRSELSPMQSIALKIATRWVINSKGHKQQECDGEDNEQPQHNEVGDRDRTDLGRRKDRSDDRQRQRLDRFFPRRRMPRGDTRPVKTSRKTDDHYLTGPTERPTWWLVGHTHPPGHFDPR